MSRRTAMLALLIAFGVGIAFLVLMGLRFNPIAIDANWYGVPIPPCFINAKECYGHVLGTDNLGRDLLARLVTGGGVSLGLSVEAIVCELVLAIIFGSLARRGGAFVRFTIERLADAISCFPAWPMLFALAVLMVPSSKAALSGSALAAIAAALFWPRASRLIIAAPDLRKAMPAVLNQAALDLTRIIVLLATIDFFGRGIQPPTASWGNILTDAQEDLTTAWWVVAFPALFMFAAIAAIEIFRRRLFVADDAGTHTEPQI